MSDNKVKIPPFIIQQLYDEGTGDPYFARLFNGILGLQDIPLSHKAGDRKANRDELHYLYNPVWETMTTAREAVKKIDVLVLDHLKKVSARNVIRIQPNAIVISENINKELRSLLNTFIINSIIAATSVQKVTKFWNLDIHCFYGKPVNFNRGIAQFEKDGYGSLAAFLIETRNWYQPFKKLRDNIEHEGWVLPDVRYDFNKGVILIPAIQGQPLVTYAKTVFNKLASFIENIVVYALCINLPSGIAIVEIPEAERDPANKQRFQFDLERPGVVRWDIRYSEYKFL